MENLSELFTFIFMIITFLRYCPIELPFIYMGLYIFFLTFNFLAIKVYIFAVEVHGNKYLILGCV